VDTEVAILNNSLCTLLVCPCNSLPWFWRPALPRLEWSCVSRGDLPPSTFY